MQHIKLEIAMKLEKLFRIILWLFICTHCLTKRTHVLDRSTNNEMPYIRTGPQFKI